MHSLLDNPHPPKKIVCACLWNHFVEYFVYFRVISPRSSNHNYICPTQQIFYIPDITHSTLEQVGDTYLNVKYLSTTDDFKEAYPIRGIVYRPNRRLMVNLVCRRAGDDEQPFVNIIFMFVNSSYNTFICKNAMEALSPTTT